jgi:signal transduction histidine kinase
VRLGIKGKQIVAVTAIVGMAVVALSVLNVARLAGVVLHESHARAQLLSNAIFHRAREVVPGNPDAYAALRTDPGLRSILESSIYGESVTGAAILDNTGAVVASSDPTRVGQRMAGGADLAALLNKDAIEQLRVIYSPEGQTLEAREPMTLGDQAFGSIRIGISTLLMRQELNASLRPALLTAAIALAVAILVAGLLAQLFLRPIHVIRSGLTRLGQGEQGVTLDLPPGDEFGDLGRFFNEVSQQLSADRTSLTGKGSNLQSTVERAVAYSRKLVALGRLTAGIAHEVKNPLNAMMIHLELLRTKIRSGALAPVPEPQPVAATGGLGLAEPQRSPASDQRVHGALQHVEIIESEIHRLDEVVQGFLKFTRPEDLQLQAVDLSALLHDLLPLIEPEAQVNHVKVTVEASPALINGDAAMLRQAFLNLAINACQAMPGGGTLRLATAPAANDRVEVRVEDTGIGIAPEHLQKIFDLYFTTKEHGTGIGLSMVYRIIQMHDGELEVESTQGSGTTFRVMLPQAH